MNLFDKLAIRLSVTRMEMLVISGLLAGLLTGIVLDVFHNGAVPADTFTTGDNQKPISDARVDSLLREAALLHTAAPRKSTQQDGTARTQNSPTEAEATASAEPTGTIVFSSASPEELSTIPGIGKVMAERLIEFRQSRHGNIAGFEDLLEVKGIGRKRLETLQQHLILE
ncbi:helix-hairpin-helix domain-containing protein [Prosthecochloris sp. N3]|uniref:Helix-hairpin-helix domain-containing protein n=1 Tax=Prosthecochloris ethylica TaxID=2743976 RepID=A0ABR9XNY2_9CHLB|nr:helix-hairpin-helix domain-containing protein [Prosthecochloris ethylica]MBF0585765.1 helix-hairpin-helix domain-containing protein [Prosthecochloris ethylica]MBF0635675.1 helix-hairpin-helix domain-containing protein [Prosthecochloris ethylica]MEC9486534.1 helix-hairpin-helix domain-containing protein [Prosthecochloris sp.]NUK46974.1 helix-hairpin-helix domain-containing protein [Prosthecochloris ethylica]